MRSDTALSRRRDAQDDVAETLARPAHGRETVDHGGVQPDQRRVHRP